MTWQADAVNILTEVLADDLNGGRVIVTTPAEIGLTDPTAIGGWWSPTVYDCLGAEDRDCVVVVCENLWPTWVERIGVALHEASHWLDLGRKPLQRSKAIREIVPQDTDTQSRVDLLFRMIAAAQVSQLDPVGVPRWYGHGSDFVRCAAILAHRAGLIAESIRPRHLRFGNQYFPAPYGENAWLTLLGEEVCLQGGIRSIIAQEAPQRFREHFSYATTSED